MASEITCVACMECIPESKQSSRPCGHMMCVLCDASWRSRGKVEEVKMKKKGTSEKCSVFITVSSCPMCRRKDEPMDYMSRSKESLFQEIQFLTQTLFLYRIKGPMTCTQPIDMDTVAPVLTPVVAPVLTPVVAPVLTPVAPASVIRQLVTPVPHHTSANVPISRGICSRRPYGCTTVRTKLRCRNCNRMLCRDCRGVCDCTLL